MAEAYARFFECDAKYRRFIVGQIALAMADVARDRKRRADGGRPTIPDTYLDQEATGQVFAMVTKLNPRERAPQLRARRSAAK